MSRVFGLVLTALLGLSGTQAHIALTFPAPYYASYNPDTPQALVDSSLTSPLTTMSQFPCRGKTGAVLAPTDPGGQSQVTWSPGKQVNATTGNGALHGGGSCQISLSYDDTTWKVVHSFMGNCPGGVGANMDFTIPSDAPTGPATLLWTWFNKIGNREMYANCAAVTIAGAPSTKQKRASVPFADRPSPFIANLGNGCKTVETTDLVFPDPGPDVTGTGSSGTTLTGTCGNSTTAASGASDGANGGATASGSSSATDPAVSAVASSGVSSASSSEDPSSGQCVGSCRGDDGSSSAALSTSSTPDQSTSGDAPPAAAASSGSSASAASTSSNATLIISPDGTCGISSYTCTGYAKGSCCSQYGYCGSTDEYCGQGCQAAFGTCGTSTSSPAAAGEVGQGTSSGLLGNTSSSAVVPGTGMTVVATSSTPASLSKNATLTILRSSTVLASFALTTLLTSTVSGRGSAIPEVSSILASSSTTTSTTLDPSISSTSSPSVPAPPPPPMSTFPILNNGTTGDDPSLMAPPPPPPSAAPSPPPSPPSPPDNAISAITPVTTSVPSLTDQIPAPSGPLQPGATTTGLVTQEYMLLGRARRWV